MNGQPDDIERVNMGGRRFSGGYTMAAAVAVMAATHPAPGGAIPGIALIPTDEAGHPAGQPIVVAVTEEFVDRLAWMVAHAGAEAFRMARLLDEHAGDEAAVRAIMQAEPDQPAGDTRRLAEAITDLEPPVALCPSCGRRIYGDVAERGVCLACLPVVPDDGELVGDDTP